jgi:putative molybdopterin biosynthesis protein
MPHERNIYLNMKTLEQARAEVLRLLDPSRSSREEIPVSESVGRVLAEPVFARLSSPNFHAAAMDGIAVAAESTFGAHPDRPLTLDLGREALMINTGRVLPEGMDAVIMIEQVQVEGDARVTIEAPAIPWQHVRKMGEDIVATELLFPRGHRVTPYCTGALLSGGVYRVSVHARPRVLIIPTGSELLEWQDLDGGAPLEPGRVIESNATVLGALARVCGAEADSHGHIMDVEDDIVRAVEKGVDAGYSAVLIIGGSSAGSMDFARPVIERLGEVRVHGVTIMPGKPVIIGQVRETPIFGIPGYPVSAVVAFEQLVAPLLAGLQQTGAPTRPTIPVVPTRNMTSKLGVEEFVRVKLGRVGDRVLATGLPRGAGSITTLTEADGIIRIPAHVEGIAAHETVRAELIRDEQVIDDTIVITGSHDILLDLLADELRAENRGWTLSSSHVGSLGGLIAVKKGFCHLAGSHLLDPEDGSYNKSYIAKHLPDRGIQLVNLSFREQGFIVRPGNPKGIREVADLTRDGVSFVNRQPGSGTRILLDLELRQAEITPQAVAGYENDEYTHMAVAAAVLSGRADAGLGIFAAAKALGLEFVPLVTEQYDLVIPTEQLETPALRALLETIRTDRFKRRVEAIGGYDVSRAGEIVWEQFPGE